MKTRFLNFWETALDSFWFLPTLMTLGAWLLSVWTLSLDRRYDTALSTLQSAWWLFDGGADGARTLLSTVASSIITVAGTTFSITIAALALASSQFGPRLLRNFTHDTGNQASLGVFVGTFLYCVLILRTIRSVDENVFVPHLSVMLGLLMGVFSLLTLIYFIHHIAETIQAPNIAAGVGRDLCGAAHTIFPEHLGVAGAHRVLDMRCTHEVRAPRTGYIQGIDPNFIDALSRFDAVAVLSHRPGDWVVEGDVLLRLSKVLDTKAEKTLRESYIIGTRRTRTQDIEYSQNQLVEMALRALSPAINDPFTAVACLDWIGAFLSRVAERGIPSPQRFDGRGTLRVVADPITFDGLCDAAFHAIRQYARGSAAVLIHLMETLEIVLRHTKSDEEGASHRATLLRHAQMVQRAGSSLDEANDHADLDERFAHFDAALREFGL